MQMPYVHQTERAERDQSEQQHRARKKCTCSVASNEPAHALLPAAGAHTCTSYIRLHPMSLHCVYTAARTLRILSAIGLCIMLRMRSLKFMSPSYAVLPKSCHRMRGCSCNSPITSNTNRVSDVIISPVRRRSIHPHRAWEPNHTQVLSVAISRKTFVRRPSQSHPLGVSGIHHAPQRWRTMPCSCEYDTCASMNTHSHYTTTR